jgi:hypothetical protein
MGAPWLMNITLCIKDSFAQIIMLKIPETINRCIMKTLVQDGATGFPLDMFSILQARNMNFML